MTTRERFRIGDRVRTSGGEAGVIIDKARQAGTQTYTVELADMSMAFAAEDLTLVGHDRGSED